jgi:hypothetical protein
MFDLASPSWIGAIETWFTSRRSNRFHMLDQVQVLECRTLLSAVSGDVNSIASVTLSADASDLSSIPAGSPATTMAGTSTQSESTDLSGLTFPAEIQVGELAVPISIAVSQVFQSETLDCWIDWNGDGTFGGASEHVAVQVPVVAGDNTLKVDVPAFAQSGSITVRFRLNSSELDNAGVQIYQFTLLPPNRSSGQFGPAIPIDTTNAVQFTSTADLDRDGDLDILSATFDGTGTIAWYENNGNQNFTQHVITTSAYDATSVIAADINGDGYLDVVVASLGDNLIEWFENNGHQQFAQHIITTSALLASSLFVADIDGDGDPDIVAASKGDNQISWYENLGSQGFTKHVVTTAVSAPCSVFAADMNGDGKLDIVAASFSNNSISWYQNDGNQHFTKQTITTTAGGVRGMFVADLNGDGYQDVIASCLYDNTITWYQNDGHGGFTRHLISSTALNPSAVYAADLDGDGDLDVVAGSRGDETIAWYENTGDMHFTQHIITTTNIQSRGVIVADVNGDGNLDVISASKYGNRLAWFENLGTPTPLIPTLESVSPLVTNNQMLPVTINLSELAVGLTADSLIVQNGTISNFKGSGLSYSFDLTITHEGQVSVTLPSNTITDLAGHGNSAATFTRELTISPPAVTGSGTGMTFVGKGLPIVVVPNVAVAGSRVSGGKLVLVLTRSKPDKSLSDVLDDFALNALGTATRTATASKRVTTVLLDPSVTSDEIQTALKSITFSTSKFGLNVKSRQLQIQLTDNSGISQSLLSQTILVMKREPVIRQPKRL